MPMEELYSTLLPYGQVHSMTWSGNNLVAVSLSEELPENITEGNERLCQNLECISTYVYNSLLLQNESELPSCV